MLDFQRVPVSGGGGRGGCMGHEEFWGKRTVAATVTEETLPFCFPASPTSPPVAITGQPYQNTRPGGEEGTETPVPNTWPCILLIFSCLPVVSAESSVWGFFAVFELVASAFLRAAPRAPSRAAHFDLLVSQISKGSKCTFEFHSNAIQGIWSKTEMNTLYIRVNTKRSRCVYLK